MPTWPEIQAYARGKYKLAKDEEDRFAVVFKEQNERTQMIWVRRFTAFNQEWIEFKSYICKEDEMSPKVAVRKNAELAVGAICLFDTHYALVHNAPLKHLDVEEFELPLNVVSTQADNLEKMYSADRDAY
jgi:hypothetical protein